MLSRKQDAGFVFFPKRSLACQEGHGAAWELGCGSEHPVLPDGLRLSSAQWNVLVCFWPAGLCRLQTFAEVPKCSTSQKTATELCRTGAKSGDFRLSSISVHAGPARVRARLAASLCLTWLCWAATAQALGLTSPLSWQTQCT